jgi:hypothetical protein
MIDSGTARPGEARLQDGEGVNDPRQRWARLTRRFQRLSEMGASRQSRRLFRCGALRIAKRVEHAPQAAPGRRAELHLRELAAQGIEK